MTDDPYRVPRTSSTAPRHTWWTPYRAICVNIVMMIVLNLVMAAIYSSPAGVVIAVVLLTLLIGVIAARKHFTAQKEP